MPINNPSHCACWTEKIIPNATITRIPRNTSSQEIFVFFAIGSITEVQKVCVDNPAKHIATVETLAAPKNNSQCKEMNTPFKSQTLKTFWLMRKDVLE